MSKLFTEDVLNELIETSGLSFQFSRFADKLNEVVDILIAQDIDEKVALNHIFSLVGDDLEWIQMSGGGSSANALRPLLMIANDTLSGFNYLYWRQRKDDYTDALVNIFKRLVKNETKLLGSNLTPAVMNVLPQVTFELVNIDELAYAQDVITKRLDDDEFEYNISDKLGNYAFPNLRDDDLPPERDTKIESDLQSQLRAHFMGKTGGISAKGAKHMIDLKSRGMYRDVFKDSNSSTIYRGMAIQFDQLLKLFDKEVAAQIIRDIMHEDVYIEMPFTYKPRKIVSSWTTSIENAFEFADSAAGKIMSPAVFDVVLYADSSKDSERKFAGEDGLYKLDFTIPYQGEDEVVCLGDVTVHAVEIRPCGYQPYIDWSMLRDKIIKLYGVDVDEETR